MEKEGLADRLRGGGPVSRCATAPDKSVPPKATLATVVAKPAKVPSLNCSTPLLLKIALHVGEAPQFAVVTERKEKAPSGTPVIAASGSSWFIPCMESSGVVELS